MVSQSRTVILLRNVPLDTKIRFKEACKKQKITMTKALIKLMEKVAKGE